MSHNESRIGDLPATLSTFIFLSRALGSGVVDSAVCDLCDRVQLAIESGSAEEIEAAGDELCGAVSSIAEGGDVAAALGRVYGSESVETSFGVDRAAALRGIRRYAFVKSRPWLAGMVERVDGELVTQWVIVEELGEGTVTLMDPWPWDSLEEERVIPTWEFLVKWELAGSPSARLNS